MTSIRAARGTDAPALAAIAERTFRATFSAITPPDDMNLYCAATYSAVIQAAEIADPNLVTLLAESDGELIGYAQWRRRASIDCVTAVHPSELSRIYVIAEWHGRGVAHDLMQSVLAGVTQTTSDALWLGVWEHNLKAQAFYRKFGFDVIGEHVFAVGHDMQQDLIMVRPIDRDT